MDTYNCRTFGTDCEKTLVDWVGGNTTLTLVVNVLLALAVVGLLCWATWYLIWYRSRPLCVDCLRHGAHKRTTYSYGVEPVCGRHYDERDMATEPTYKCPKHKVDLVKAKFDCVTIDRCPHGCAFLDNGELDQLTNNANAQGLTTGVLLGTAMG